MRKVAVVVMLMGCGGKANPCEKGSDGAACLKFADEKADKAKMSEVENWYRFACTNGAYAGCAKAADVYAAEKNWEMAMNLYLTGCTPGGDAKACLTGARLYRDGEARLDKDPGSATLMFKRGCELKDDTACKELAAMAPATPTDGTPKAPSGGGSELDQLRATTASALDKAKSAATANPTAQATAVQDMAAMAAEVCTCSTYDCAKAAMFTWGPRVQKYASLTGTPEQLAAMKTAVAAGFRCVDLVKANAGTDSGADKMTDLAFCNFLMTTYCGRCAAAHSMTVEACVKSQSVDACAGLEGKATLNTPADFRAKCAAAMSALDCNQQLGGIPEACAPPP